MKHIGRIVTNKRRVIVVYRTIPGDPYSALVILTEGLPADEHDSLIKILESPAGQNAFELYEVMSRSYLPDGRNMLAGLNNTGQLKKVATKDIEMTPDINNTIPLDQLNNIIAQQKGIAIEDLAVQNPNAKKEQTAAAPVVTEQPITESIATNEVLTDDVIAAQYRSQAASLFKEAKRLREQADELSPTKKKTTTKKKETVESSD